MNTVGVVQSNPFDLTDQVAVVTGGGSGIGLGFAEGLSRAGCAVAILGRNTENLESAAERLRSTGNQVLAVPCDVVDEQQVRAAMTRVVEEFGRLDSCFANAGMTGEPIAFVDATLADFRAVTTVNLDGVFLTLREAARHMIALGNGGSLIATSSMGSRFGAPRMQAYGASKAAVTAMVNGIAVELAPYGIRANTVLPGWAQTPMTDTVFGTPRVAGGLLRRIPAKRWGQPQDFSAIAVYLASPASVYHTADSILIDGGYSAF